jgi:hypothetical protein
MPHRLAGSRHGLAFLLSVARRGRGLAHRRGRNCGEIGAAYHPDAPYFAAPIIKSVTAE